VQKSPPVQTNEKQMTIHPRRTTEGRSKGGGICRAWAEVSSKKVRGRTSEKEGGGRVLKWSGERVKRRREGRGARKPVVQAKPSHKIKRSRRIRPGTQI